MARILFVSHSAALRDGSSQSLLKLLKYLRFKHHVEVVIHRSGDLLDAYFWRMMIPSKQLVKRVIKHAF